MCMRNMRPHGHVCRQGHVARCWMWGVAHLQAADKSPQRHHLAKGRRRIFLYSKKIAGSKLNQISLIYSERKHGTNRAPRLCIDNSWSVVAWRAATSAALVRARGGCRGSGERARVYWHRAVYRAVLPAPALVSRTATWGLAGGRAGRVGDRRWISFLCPQTGARGAHGVHRYRWSCRHRGGLRMGARCSFVLSNVSGG